MTQEVNSIKELKTSIPRDKFLVMQCGHVRIAITTDAISMPKQIVEEHDHFEFFIPLSNMTYAYIGKKKIDCHCIGILTEFSSDKFSSTKHIAPLIIATELHVTSIFLE